MSAVEADLSMRCPLTLREWQVLACIAAGDETEDIMQKLFIARSTTKHHRSQILKKLGMPHMPGAVGLAYREGWL